MDTSGLGVDRKDTLSSERARKRSQRCFQHPEPAAAMVCLGHMHRRDPPVDVGSPVLENDINKMMRILSRNPEPDPVVILR
jgi:hypothetical protein